MGETGVLYVQSRSRVLHIIQAVGDQLTRCNQPVASMTFLPGYAPDNDTLVCQRCKKAVQSTGEPEQGEMSEAEKLTVLWIATDVETVRSRAYALWEITPEGPRKEKLFRLVRHLNAASHVLSE